jgi:hypothetical protein
MNPFDKLCSITAFLLGIVFLVLGVIGLFAGCSAHFTLPPVLGVIPAFVGWGMVRPIWVAWSRPTKPVHYYEQPREPHREMRELDYWDDEQGKFKQ